mmetsp:Transcript_63842/g.178649  ORF Transcript_63842/g.178649 Transcript_63842/m.178649 type:complete len:125 (-) Transcript_63842:59-433(-)
MMWSVITYGVAPLGLLVWALLLSGLKPLQKVSRAVISLNVSVAGVALTLPMLIALFSAIAWVSETVSLFILGDRSPSTYQREHELAKKWRLERNWWILNFNLLLWLTNWRVAALVSKKQEAKDD